MEYYAAKREKELLPFVTAWMNLESVMLSEISQAVKKYIPYDLTYKWNLINKANKQENITRDIERENKLAATRGEWDKEGQKEKDCQGTCIKDP